MSIDVRQPKLRVLLQKNVGRASIAQGVPVSERYRGRARTVDLAAYLGEAGGVQVSKSVRAPSGTFSITLTDMVSDVDQDSIYGLVEPMDVVEISMVGQGHLIAAKNEFPVMMRGFVSNVQRRELIGPDGKPQRAVVVVGHDYGKIWQIYQYFNLPNTPTGQQLITSFPFFQQFGAAFNTMLAHEFAQEVVNLILNPYLQKMRLLWGMDSLQSSPIMTLDTEITASDGVVQPFGLGGWSGGTVYALLHQYCDVGPWNELFIEDRQEGPCMVYRPNPFMSADGQNYILPQQIEPVFVPITASDVVGLVAGRSDADVANYFWVDAPNYAMFRPEVQRMAAYYGTPDTFFLQDYGNVNPALYGMRKMEEQTMQGAPEERNNGNGVPDGQMRDVDNVSAVEWVTERRRQLVEQNKDNVALETGTLRLKGNHEMRAGRYARLTRGKVQSDYYAVTVVHDFKPFGNYFTTVTFERGTNFIDRVKMDAPYYSERSGA